jgi:hypothetical protein
MTGTLREDLCTFMIISRPILLRFRNVSDKSCRKIDMLTLRSVTFSCFPRFSDIVDNYDKARQATGDNIMGRMHIACSITKTADTLRMCYTY